MSAIAHRLERAGIATVVIGLVKLHLEKINPPRALWVPFELGRPMGPPNDAEFQRDVLRAALSLLHLTRQADSDSGVLVDFPHEDPNSVDDPQWRPPAEHTSAQAFTSVSVECAALAAEKSAAVQRYGRDPVGVAGLTIDQAAAFFDAVCAVVSDDPLPASPREDLSSNLALRFVADDLKAYYLQAAAAVGKPSSRQLHNWLWRETRLGQSLKSLRRQFLDGNDDKRTSLGNKFMVPRAFVD